MRWVSSLMLAGMIGWAALPAAAAPPTETTLTAAQATTRQADVARESAALRTLSLPLRGAPPARRTPGTDAGPAAPDTASIIPIEVQQTSPSANRYRAYPPSCIADPLPVPQLTEIAGPVYTRPGTGANVRLAAINSATNQYTDEMVNVYIWRMPCSSGNSVTLMTIRRQTANEGRTSIYPLFPGVRVSQSGSTYLQARMAIEPNTVISATLPDSPFFNSSTWLLENFPQPDSDNNRYKDYNFAHTVRLLNFFSGDQGQDIAVADYRTADYAQPLLPINGYFSGNYYDAAHNGEGINFEVGEYPDTDQRYVFFAWFTYDDTGRPYWISGSAPISDTDSANPTRTISMDTAYSTNGGFFGNFGPTSTAALWGRVTFSFPSCNSMQLSWTSVAGLPAGIPGRGPNGGGASGSRTWTRLTELNGLTCDMPPLR